MSDSLREPGRVIFFDALGRDVEVRPDGSVELFDADNTRQYTWSAEAWAILTSGDPASAFAAGFIAGCEQGDAATWAVLRDLRATGDDPFECTCDGPHRDAHCPQHGQCMACGGEGAIGHCAVCGETPCGAQCPAQGAECRRDGCAYERSLGDVGET